MKRPTISDVAKLANVSKPAVSQVLNNHPKARISPATRARVEQAAAELGYQPNRIAVSLARGRTATFGVIVPDLRVLFYAGIVDGIEAAATQANHRILVAHSRNDAAIEARMVETLLDHRVDGIICMSLNSHRDGGSTWLNPSVLKRLPFVLVDESAPEVPVDTITSDDRSGARMATEHLIARGHRRIAFLGTGSPRSTARDRLAGYRDALTSAQLPFDPSLEIGQGYDVTAVADMLLPLLRSANRPTALLAANDYLAMSAIEVAHAENLALGRDLAVVGYSNDCLLARALRLTSVDQSASELGRRAVECLLARLADADRATQSIVVPTALVVRESSAGQLNANR